MEEVLVSVIIPTYKGADKLSRAIDSAVNQTYKRVEIIVVDDNDPGTRGRTLTEKLLADKKYSKINYIKHECNKNGAAARNTGIQHASGKYICFLDDDDFYLPERIKKSVGILEKNPMYDAVYCGVFFTDSDGIKKEIKAEKPLLQKEILLNEMVIGTGSNLFVSKKALSELEGFDEDFYRHQDIEFMVRLLGKFQTIHLNEGLIVKALNKTNNIPDYKKLARIKNLLFQKFNREINQLAEREKQEFFYQQHNLLLHAAYKSKNKGYIKEAMYSRQKYQPLTLDEKIRSMVVPYKYLDMVYQRIFKSYLLWRLRKVKHADYQKEPAIHQETKDYILQVLAKNQ